MISWSIGDLRQVTSNAEAAAFAIRRVFRLLPSYFVLAALLWVLVVPQAVKAPVQVSILEHPVAYWVRFATLMSYFGPDHTVYRGLEWTLAYEVMFYCACTACILLRRWTARSNLLFLPVTVLCVMTLLPPDVTGNKAQNFGLIYLYFMCGVSAYLWKCGCLSGLAFALVTVACSGSILLRLVLWAIRYHEMNPWTLAAPAALLIFYGMLFLPLRAPKWLAKVGLISYSLYLLHDSVPFAAPLSGIPLWLRPAGWMILALCAGAASYLAVEKPAIRAGKSVVGMLNRQARPSIAPARS